MKGDSTEDAKRLIRSNVVVHRSAMGHVEHGAIHSTQKA
jgi:hypothetical protein